MTFALLSALGLFLVLFALALVLLCVARVLCFPRGVGHGPTVAAGRAACPMAQGGGCPARPQCPCPSVWPAPCGVGAVARTRGQSAAPALNPPSPSPRAMADGPAAGAPRQAWGSGEIEKAGGASGVCETFSAGKGFAPRARQLECGQPAHPALRGRPHAQHVGGQVVHAGETGARLVLPCPHVL